MAGFAAPWLGEHPNLDEIESELRSLEKEIVEINDRTAEYNQERQIEDYTTRRSRASQDELITCTRRKEDLRFGGEECILREEQINTQLMRVREDELLASNRRKEDAGIALRRIGENRDCDLIKLALTKKQRQLKSAIENILRPRQSGHTTETMSDQISHGVKKEDSRMGEQRGVILGMDNSTREELKHIGIEFLPLFAHCLAEEQCAPTAALFQSPSSQRSMPVHRDKHLEWQQQQGNIHPSRLELLAQDSLEVPLTPTNGIGNTTAKHTQVSCPVLTTILNDSGSLNALMGPSRKRKATSPALSENSDLPFLVEKKRISLGPNGDGTQRSKNHAFQPSLGPIIKEEPISPQALAQQGGKASGGSNQHRLPRIPTGPKLHLSTVAIRNKFNQQLLPGTPTGPRLHFSNSGILQADIRNLLGYTPSSGIVNCQPMLIMQKKDQVHAPVTERAKGIYYTLLHPEPPLYGQFPVVVCPDAGNTYRYLGNYGFEGSRLLQDSEVDILGEETCRALVTSQLMDMSQGASIVKREISDILIIKGIVRTEKEAIKVTALDLAKRMKHTKLTPNLCGKPIKRMDIFANKLVFRSFNNNFYTQYFRKSLV